MFGLGPMEIVVIAILALLVLGPKRIPEAASSLGKAIRSFRRATRELRDQIDIDDEVRRPIEDLRAALRDEPAALPAPAAAAAALAAPAAATAPALVKPPEEPVVSSGAEERAPDRDGGSPVAPPEGASAHDGPAAAPLPVSSLPSPALDVAPIAGAK